jgi:hypothetical protein
MEQVTVETRRPKIGQLSKLLTIVTSLIVIVAVLAMLLRLRSSAPQQVLPPGLHLGSDTLDLGTVAATGTATASFRLSNTGSATYQIEKIVPECGCTVVRISDPVLRPNTQTEIPVTVQGAGWGDGLRTKLVAVHLKDGGGNTSNIVLKVTAMVQNFTDLAVIPARIDVPDARAGEALTVPIFVHGDKSVVDDLPSEIEIRAGAKNHLRIAPPKRQGWRASREIAVNFILPSSASPIKELLEIEIAGDYQQNLRIPVRIDFQQQNIAQNSH